MKKLRIIALTICLFLSLNICFAVDPISPYYAIYNADNLEMLLGENNAEEIAIASITKVMTSIVAIENIDDINAEVVIDTSLIQGKVDPELVTAGIYNGQTLTYYDLFAGTLVSSSADCAVYLANVVFDSQDEFISKMNEKAKSIGMTNTSFSNVTGLDDENNYSTLDDVAKMMKYALENNTLKEIMSLKEYTMTDGNLTCYSTIEKLTKRQGITDSCIIGGKTGTTGDAGLCLASFSEDEGVGLICIVTGVSMYSQIPYNVIDTQNIYEEVIQNYSLQNIVKTDDVIKTLESVCTKQKSIEVKAKKDIKYYTDTIKDELKYIQYDGMPSVDYTVKKGDTLGKVNVYYANELIDSFDVYLDEELEFSLIEWIKINKEAIITLAIIIFVMIVIIIGFAKSGKKQKSSSRKK